MPGHGEQEAGRGSHVHVTARDIGCGDSCSDEIGPRESRRQR